LIELTVGLKVKYYEVHTTDSGRTLIQ